MKIEKATVKSAGSGLIVNQQTVAEKQRIAVFRKYLLLKMDGKFYLVSSPNYEGGFWDALQIDTESAVGIKKEFNSASDDDPYGPKLCKVVVAAFNMNLW